MSLSFRICGTSKNSTWKQMRGGVPSGWFHFSTLTLQAKTPQDGSPTKNALSPRARAFSTSLPVRIPPSRYTSTFPFTAATTALSGHRSESKRQVWLRDFPLDSQGRHGTLPPGLAGSRRSKLGATYVVLRLRLQVLSKQGSYIPKARDSFRPTLSCCFVLDRVQVFTTWKKFLVSLNIPTEGIFHL